MGSLANAFALLGDDDQEASTIVAVKTAEVKKITEEHKKIVAEQKKIAAKKKKAAAKKNKKKSSGGQKSLDGNAVDHQRRYFNGTHQRNGRSDEVVSKEEDSHIQTLKTLKEYEEQKALEKQHKADKSTSLCTVPAESTPLREAATLQDDFQTKQKSKNGPARGRGTQDSRKNMNNGNYKAGYSKRNQDNPLPQEDKTVKVKPEAADVKVKPEAAAAPDLSETNFPVLGEVAEPTKSSVELGRWIIPIKNFVM